VKPFDYTRPPSVKAALDALGSGARPLAGGTDMLTLLKADLVAVDSLIDLKTTELSRGIEQLDTGVRIGALATLSEIGSSQLLAEHYPLLGEAVSMTATRQIRNRATLGGNLLQRPRCWYFREGAPGCWLNGGEDCLAVDGRNEHHAIYGGGPCHAAHPSDLAACLVALDAVATLSGPNGVRRVPLGELFELPTAGRRTETVLADDELLCSVDLPPLTSGWRSVYLKSVDRNVWAFALVGLALTVHIERNRVDEARVVLASVAPIPWRHRGAEQALRGAREADAAHGGNEIGAALDALARDAEPLAGNAYKIELARRLLKRAIDMTLGGRR
jgi:xanthine dehydrogenase YagS FAD-binding subunit